MFQDEFVNVNDKKDTAILKNIPDVSKWALYTDPVLHVSFKYPPIADVKTTTGSSSNGDEYRIDVCLQPISVVCTSISSYPNDYGHLGYNRLEYTRYAYTFNNQNSKVVYYSADDPNTYYYLDDPKRFWVFRFQNTPIYAYQEPNATQEAGEILDELKSTIVISE